MTPLSIKRISGVILGLSLLAGTISKADTPALSLHQSNLLCAELQKRADNGEVKAQIELGIRYETGNGLPQNTQAAEKYLKQAAEQGNEEAAYNLGLLYYQGKNIPPDFKKAHDYFTKAAALGNPEANRALGIMSAKGDFVPKDPQKAAEYFQKAEKLKKEHLIVKGTPAPHRTKSEIYRAEINKLEEKAEYGDAEDQYLLGLMYFHGKGVTKNTEKAKYWLRKACYKRMERACADFKELDRDSFHTMHEDLMANGADDMVGGPDLQDR